jgi:hypothetical protein
MNKLRYLILILLGFTLVGCIPTTLEKVLIKKRPATLDEIQAIKITHVDEEIVAKLKMQLKTDYEIKTDGNTTVIILFLGKTEILVKPKTHIKIATDSIFISFGEVYIKTKSSFKVETEYATIVREGTEFIVTVLLREEVSVVVLEGRVGLISKADPAKSVSLKRYEQGHMRQNNPPINKGRVVTRSIIENILKSVKPINPVAYTPDIILPDYNRGICTVPSVTNMMRSRAEGFLQTAGFTEINILHKRFSQHGDWVYSQIPTSNSQVRCETEIQLTTAAK